MRGELRSTAKEVVLWWRKEKEEDAEEVVVVREDEAGWKCWKHPSQPRYGVCPTCLRDRLLRLCPDCANVRPCACLPSSSSSSSSFSSLSSAEPARSNGGAVGGPRGCGAGVGAVGPVSRLIESEPAFRRSRSVGFQLHRSRSTASAVDDAAALPPPPTRSTGGKGWPPLWPFRRAAARKEPADGKKLYRSRSVATGRFPDAGGGEEEGRGKGRRWQLPGPMKVFRRRKPPPSKVVQERSPLLRG